MSDPAETDLAETTSAPWTHRRILSELCEPERRLQIAAALFKHTEPETRALAIVQLARAMRFREQTLRKTPVGKRAEWLLARAGHPDLERLFVEALLAYHTAHARELMGACLDSWGIPHQDGAIEGESPTIPQAEAVAQTVEALRERFGLRDLLLYLASVGLVMGAEEPAWRAATWPVVDRLAGELAAT